MTNVWPSHWIHGPSHIGTVWLTGHHRNPSPKSGHRPSILRRMIAKMDPDKTTKWPSHLRPTRSMITGYLSYFLMFGCQPRLPVNLLFPTVRWDKNSRTTDKYMTSLYNKLKLALASARDTTLLEAQRQKRHYDCKAGAVELHPGDKVLAKLDSFRGQWVEIEQSVGRCPLYSG